MFCKAYSEEQEPEGAFLPLTLRHCLVGGGGEWVPGRGRWGRPSFGSGTNTRPSLASEQDRGQVRGTWAPQGEGRRAEKCGHCPGVNKGPAETSHRVLMVKSSGSFLSLLI